ncbi:MAG: hypothetical protein IJ677_00010 [Alphaproteobacteria bacterium]|nr:hypothetical protein [Alphaproteobacteria bacterium]
MLSTVKVFYTAIKTIKHPLWVFYSFKLVENGIQTIGKSVQLQAKGKLNAGQPMILNEKSYN